MTRIPSLSFSLPLSTLLLSLLFYCRLFISVRDYLGARRRDAVSFDVINKFPFVGYIFARNVSRQIAIIKSPGVYFPPVTWERSGREIGDF